MSIAINLLPDVRLARIRAQHIRRLAFGIAIAVWIVVGVIIALLLLGLGAQKLVLSHVNGQIADDTSQILSTKNLNSALTDQQILENLPGLYGSRTYFSKFMPAVAAAMPSTVSLSSISDGDNTVSVTGSGQSVYAVDQFYEGLKAAKMKSGQSIFSDVTLNTVSVSAGVAGFTLTANVTPEVTSGQ